MNNKVKESNKVLTVPEIYEKVLAGKAAIENDELKVILNSFTIQLRELVDKDPVTVPVENLQSYLNLLNIINNSELANDFSESLDKELFYNFGEKLFSSSEIAAPELLSIISEYLNLFRRSNFLVKIYNEERWPDLINRLIKRSNFTIADMFLQRAAEYKNKSIFTIIKGQAEFNFSFEQVRKQVDAFSKNLISLLISREKPNGKIAFLMENSLNMVMLDLACLTSGIVNIMIPAASVTQHISYILNETEAPVILISDEKQLSKIKSVKNELKYLKLALLLEGNSAEDWVISFSEFQKYNSDSAEDKLNELAGATSTESLAAIMYTSGTTGTPKGIMFSNMNIVFKRFCRAMALPHIGDNDKFLSFLPLFHTFGRYFEMMGSIFWGAEYVFMENPAVETMLANMQAVKPSIFISIPKKWIQLYEYIIQRVDIELADEELILEEVKKATGGKLKWGLSAAGFLPPDIFQFFQKYGVELMSGFGMTEATGGITMTPPGEYRPNSLGKALPGMQIKLADDGELVISGQYVMMGYFNQPHNETFIDENWLPTGDVMREDENGFIEIIDRKKEIYKNIKGETIAPQKIENLFRDFEFVKQVFLVGDHRPYNTVLIFPNKESEKFEIEELTDEQMREYYSSLIVSVNKFLAPFERILDFRIVDREFAAEKGELTPKGTYKRRVIEKNFEETIETMYRKEFISVLVSGTEIRIPNWFLREKGCLNTDIVSLANGISIPKLQLMLKIEKDEQKKTFRIGNFIYKISTRYIDLQQFLTNPLYWLGNDELLEFTGESIIQWYRQNHRDTHIEFISAVFPKAENNSVIDKLKLILSAGEQSLFGLHLASLMLQYSNQQISYFALQYFDNILKDDSLVIYKFARVLIAQPSLSSARSVRHEMFKLASKKSKGKDFQELLLKYLHYDYDLLDDNVIQYVARKSGSLKNLSAIENVISNVVSNQKDLKDIEHTPLPFLFNFLNGFGIQHPTLYEHIRQTLVKYQVQKDWKELSKKAHQVRGHLRSGFRNWLGSNETVAVDMETGDEYRWEDVIITEDDIDKDDRDRILNALTETAVLREAIFLFYGGKQIRLNNILPGGVWVSHLRSYHDKSVYRVSVQTRLLGSFDIVLNLNKNRTKKDIRDEVNWLILAGSRFFMQELVEDVGGYWDKYDLWSGKFVPGETVARFIKRESRRKDEASQKRLYYLWPYFVWNASAAYFNFLKLTGKEMQLKNPTADNFIIPSHDYQTGSKVVSFSERTKYTSLIDLFMNFYNNFVKIEEEKCTYLKRDSIWNHICSGVIDAKGEEKGSKILGQFKIELEKSSVGANKDDILNKVSQFLDSIETDGFIPKQLYFAIKRFHRWFRLNEDASINAQAQMMYELYDTYQLPQLEKLYAETRTKFFLETAFFNSSEELRKLLWDIIVRHHYNQISKEEEFELISRIKTEVELNEKEEFFITRLGFPHIKPTDSAMLEEFKTGDKQTTNLVVQFEDYDGIPFIIRKPISPKEISKLHQLFIETNLMVNFRPEHQFLVAISERGFIIGGLFYVRMDEETVHMEKIVVSNRYRRKGISDRLMNELFNRLINENIKFVTTGFFRPEYFYRFGFKIERKYSGLVKDISAVTEG